MPVALALIFALLYLTYGNVARRAARLHRRAVRRGRRHRRALAARHAVLDLGGVGFIALSGVAVLDDMILVSYDPPAARAQGLPLDEAVEQAAEHAAAARC